MKNIFKIVLITLLAITVGVVVAAVATGGSAAMVSLNLIWGYILAAIAVIAAIGCAVYGMISSPSGIKATIISVAIVVVVVAASYFIASGHSIEIPNIGDGGVFERGETVVTEASVLVTYVAFGAAIIAAIASEVIAAVEGMKK